MDAQVTLTLPGELYERASHWATLTRRDLSRTLIDALAIVLPPVYVTPTLEKPVSLLSDDELLALCKVQMSPVSGRRLGELLEMQREGLLSGNERQEMLALMQIYDQLWIRQSEALAEVVRRGLQKPLEP